jgi:hypothetical protein
MGGASPDIVAGVFELAKLPGCRSGGFPSMSEAWILDTLQTERVARCYAGLHNTS